MGKLSSKRISGNVCGEGLFFSGNDEERNRLFQEESKMIAEYNRHEMRFE